MGTRCEPFVPLPPLSFTRLTDLRRDAELLQDELVSQRRLVDHVQVVRVGLVMHAPAAWERKRQITNPVSDRREDAPSATRICRSS